jgi:hypothetical protein
MRLLLSHCVNFGVCPHLQCNHAQQVQRGGWGAGRGEYLLLHRTADGKLVEARMSFSGLDDELAAFVEQVAAAAA